MSTAESKQSRRFSRCPAASVLAAVAAGIGLDRFLSIPALWWLSVFGCGIAIWLPAFCMKRNPLAVGALCLLLLSGGGMHHHVRLSAISGNDVERWIVGDRQLVRLRGMISGRPVLVAPHDEGDWLSRHSKPMARCVLECREFFDDGEWQPASGRLQLRIKDVEPASVSYAELASGCEVEVSGWLSPLARPRNPGDIDFRLASRSEGIRGRLLVEGLALVTLRAPSHQWWLQARDWLRRRCDQALARNLSERTAPLGFAMLLGDRSRIDRTVQRHFIESGTAHLLAISGLHVGILAVFLQFLGRLFRMPEQFLLPVMLGLLAGYLAIADSRPPMIRAFVLVAVWSMASRLKRPLTAGNSLAVAALIILLMNPASLFDVGAQLSFLAVATILWMNAITHRRAVPQPSEQTRQKTAHRKLHALIAPRWWNWLTMLGRKAGPACSLSAAISAISAPLVAATFHIVSPIGILANVPLIPLAGVGLCFGFLSLLIGVISPIAAAPFAFVFDLSLRLLEYGVSLTASVPFGHFLVNSLPNWWLPGCYVLVAAAMLHSVRKRRPARLWFCLTGWVLFGLTLIPARVETGELRCTFLSVGHGLSVVLQAPNGRVLVYDAGSLGSGPGVARSVEATLRRNGVSAIDALIASHADVDHYNGMKPLLENVSVGWFCVSRHFPDARQPGTLELCETACALDVPLRFLSAGDVIELDPDVRIRVLHPHAAEEFGSDNAASIVLEIQWKQYRVVLTGDVENDGLVKLLHQPMARVDVLLAPHHGSRKTCPPDLARWAVPRFVVASCSPRVSINALEDIFGPSSQVLATSRDGAIEFRFNAEGIQVDCWGRHSESFAGVDESL